MTLFRDLYPEIKGNAADERVTELYYNKYKAGELDIDPIIAEFQAKLSRRKLKYLQQQEKFFGVKPKPTTTTKPSASLSSSSFLSSSVTSSTSSTTPPPVASTSSKNTPVQNGLRDKINKLRENILQMQGVPNLAEPLQKQLKLDQKELSQAQK